MGYRTRTEITAAILKVAIGGEIMTRILYGASLSYTQTVRYLADLTAIGLIKYSKKDKTYKTTPKGLQFIAAYYKIIELSVGPITAEIE